MLRGILRKIAAVAAAGLVGGCATVVTGNHQEIAVISQPSEADCILTRDGATLATVRTRTPGTVRVKRDAKPIYVTCRKEDHEDNRAVMNSSFESMSAGNLIVGGLVGVIVDAASGANSRYEPSVLVRLTPAVGGRPPAAAIAAAADAAAGVPAPVAASPFDGDYNGGLSLTATAISAQYALRQIELHVAGGQGTGAVNNTLCKPGTIILAIGPSGAITGDIDVVSNNCTDRRAKLTGQAEGDRLMLNMTVGGREIDFTMTRRSPAN